MGGSDAGALPAALLGVLAAGVLVAGQAGCGGPRTMATVSGVVSFDGRPLDSGAISFYPVADDAGSVAARSAGSTIEKDGRYRVRILPGRFRVEISSSRVVGQRKTYPELPDSPLQDVYEDFIPANYNTKSKLVQQITLETTQLDFQLESKPAAGR